MDDVDLQYVTRRLDGRLLDIEHNVLIQDPSPEVDFAWEKLSKNDFVDVSSEDLIRMGKDPSVAAKLSAEWGYGPDAYAAELDIVHKIHGLDALRKEIHFKHYYGHKYANRSQVSEGHRIHANHCLSILFQTLTCDANPDLVPFVWVTDQIHPFPDFSIQRKCGNLKTVYQWKEQHAVDRDRYVDLRLPESEKRLLLLPELKRIFGLDGDSASQPVAFE